MKQSTLSFSVINCLMGLLILLLFLASFVNSGEKLSTTNSIDCSGYAEAVDLKYDWAYDWDTYGAAKRHMEGEFKRFYSYPSNIKFDYKKWEPAKKGPVDIYKGDYGHQIVKIIIDGDVIDGPSMLRGQACDPYEGPFYLYNWVDTKEGRELRKLGKE